MKTLLELFNGCTTGVFTTSKGKLDWRRDGKTLYFAPSQGAVDWVKNFAAIPFPVIIGRTLIFVPLGVALDVPELRKILKENKDIDLVVGYSRGGWEAVLTALKLDVPCVTFGCPRVAWHPSKRLRERLCELVTHYENPNDIVCTVPPGYEHGACKKTLYGKVYSPEVTTVTEFVERESGHSPQEYRFRLEGVER